MAMRSYTSIDEHVAMQTPGTRALLAELRRAIAAAAPDATEAISYGIPTFKLNGNLVHFAGYKTHIGFYPGAAAIAAFKKELSAYETSKGTVKFSLNEPLPLALVKKIVAMRVREQKAKKAKR